MTTARTVIDDELAGGTEPKSEASDLQRAIRKIVLDRVAPPFDKRRGIRDLVRQELLLRGFLCQTPDMRGFYFDKTARRLYELDQRQFQHFLSNLSGLSATEMQFRFVLDSLQTEAAQKKSVEVHTVSFCDPKTGMLWVSDGGSGVWSRERGGAWGLGHNGDDGILFLTEPDVQPWVPDFSDSGALAWFLSQLLLDSHTGLEREEQQTLLLVFVLQNFFPALRRTRIIPAALGPQGSGKTTAMRMFGTHFSDRRLM